jgi:hypothetical protein
MNLEFQYQQFVFQEKIYFMEINPSKVSSENVESYKVFIMNDLNAFVIGIIHKYANSSYTQQEDQLILYNKYNNKFSYGLIDELLYRFHFNMYKDEMYSRKYKSLERFKHSIDETDGSYHIFEYEDKTPALSDEPFICLK